MEIVAYGSPKADCRKCRDAELLIQEIIQELGAEEKINFLKLTLQDPKAATHGVMVTPSIVIDDQIVADGKLPDRAKLLAYLTSQLGA